MNALLLIPVLHNRLLPKQLLPLFLTSNTFSLVCSEFEPGLRSQFTSTPIIWSSVCLCCLMIRKGKNSTRYPNLYINVFPLA